MSRLIAFMQGEKKRRGKIMRRGRYKSVTIATVRLIGVHTNEVSVKMNALQKNGNKDIFFPQMNAVILTGFTSRNANMINDRINVLMY